MGEIRNMANILFGICMVGKGHLIRSEVAIDYLLKQRHKVLIITGGENYLYLSKKHKRIYDAGGLKLKFKNNKISSLGTILKNAKKISIKNYKLLKKIEIEILKFNPDYAITDWEPFTSFIANKHNIPLISYDNQHYLLYGDYKVKKQDYISYLKTKPFLNAIVRNPEYSIIVALPGMKMMPKPNVILINPTIRKEIINSKPKDNGYLLIYHSIGADQKIQEILKKMRIKTIIYGFNTNNKIENITLKKFNEKEFIKDLINCKAVICSAGFTLVSEAIYLKKPILTIPIKEHFEQILNARYVEENKYGMYTKDFTTESFVSFITQINSYKTKSYIPGNGELYKILKKIIKRKK